MGLLGQPLDIKGMHLRNRIVMLPMVTNLANADGTTTDALIRHYAERAANGAGMVVVEATAIDAASRNIPRGVGIWDDGHVPGLRRLAEAIKAGGAAAAIQIFHAGAKPHPGQTPVGCSGVPLRAGERPRVMATRELAGVVEAFGVAARRAAAAGFDAVEIHAAHFYLLSEFLSPFTNRRTDGYGGDIAGRARLARETVEVVREAVGPAHPILLRLHGAERIEGGMSAEDVRTATAILAQAGVDAFSVSACNQGEFVASEDGGYWSLRPYLTRDQPAGWAADDALLVKQSGGRPVIAAGKLAHPEAAERVLAEGKADLIGIGRNFLADPEVALKLLEGRGDEILVCKQCFLCLTTTVGKQRAVRCAINPKVGHPVD